MLVLACPFASLLLVSLYNIFIYHNNNEKGKKPYRWQFSDKYPQKTRNNSRRTMLICFSLLQEKIHVIQPHILYMHQTQLT